MDGSYAMLKHVEQNNVRDASAFVPIYCVSLPVLLALAPYRTSKMNRDGWRTSGERAKEKQ